MGTFGHSADNRDRLDVLTGTILIVELSPRYLLGAFWYPSRRFRLDIHSGTQYRKVPTRILVPIWMSMRYLSVPY